MPEAAKGYYRTLLARQLVIGLVSVGLLVPLAGCGDYLGGLPTGTTPTSSTNGPNDMGPFDLEILDASAGPACARIGSPASDVHLAMYQALNQYRLENGLPLLAYSRTLETAADDHAEDLWVRDFFAHVNPSGEDPGDRAVAAGFCHEYVGENIAAGQITVDQVMQAWKDSPGHNANMLEPDYVYVGMGFYTDPRGRRYWAQEFGLDVP